MGLQDLKHQIMALEKSPLTELPVEIRQQVLRELCSLKDVESLILTCTSLFDAYKDSRIVIRKRVFWNHIFKEDPADGRDVLLGFKQAEAVLGRQIGENANADGAILREGLWEYCIKHDVHAMIRSGVVRQLSLALAKAYRTIFQVGNAEAIEKTAFEMYCSHAFGDDCSKEEPKKKLTYEGGFRLLLWLRDSVEAGRHDRNLAHGMILCRLVWGCVNTQQHRIVSDYTKALGILFNTSALTSSNLNKEAQELVDEVWAALAEANSVGHGEHHYCFFCTESATNLIKITDAINPWAGISMEKLEPIWRTVPLRSASFSAWSNLLVITHGNNRLDGLMKVWTRLSDSHDAQMFDSYDLEWARDIIMELTRQGDQFAAKAALQRDVLRFMTRGTPIRFAFGRKFSQELQDRGDLDEAITVLEDIGHETELNAHLFVSWAMTLQKLYEKQGRDKEAEALKDRILQAQARKKIASEIVGSP